MAASCRGQQRQHVEVAVTHHCGWGCSVRAWGHVGEGKGDTRVVDGTCVVIGDGACYRCVGVPVDTNSHTTCLRPRINIRLCALRRPFLHHNYILFDVTPPKLTHVQRMRGFIQTIPVDSGSNDLVLDSLRYVGDTDFYTGHLCFAASLPRCFITFLCML